MNRGNLLANPGGTRIYMKLIERSLLFALMITGMASVLLAQKPSPTPVPSDIRTSYYLAINDVKQFSDVKETDPFYKDLQSLTDDYKLAFAYADRKFHGEMPLTKGDFAFFMSYAMDGISIDVSNSKKPYPESCKPLMAKPADKVDLAKVTDLSPGMPYFDAVKNLQDKYGIVLFKDKTSFNGLQAMTHHDVFMEFVNNFGGCGVKFTKDKKFPIPDTEPTTRGEFAWILNQFVIRFKGWIASAP